MMGIHSRWEFNSEVIILFFSLFTSTLRQVKSSLGNILITLHLIVHVRSCRMFIKADEFLKYEEFEGDMAWLGLQACK
jgi:hypothetical protein